TWMGGMRAGQTWDGRGRFVVGCPLKCMTAKRPVRLAMAITRHVAGGEVGVMPRSAMKELRNSSACEAISPRASGRSLRAAVTSPLISASVAAAFGTAGMAIAFQAVPENWVTASQAYHSAAHRRGA